jgi:hypothetical protein
MIRGEDVVVHRPQTSLDSRKDPAEVWEHEPVANVLFGFPTTDDLDQAMRAYGTRVKYKIGIPKAYAASLKGCTITRMRDAGLEHPPEYRVIGDPAPIPPEICPTAWNRECYVEEIDG